MPFPIKTCVRCGEEFELKPDKPGFANRCPECSTTDEDEPAAQGPNEVANKEMNEARRKAIRDMLYRKDS